MKERNNQLEMLLRRKYELTEQIAIEEMILDFEKESLAELKDGVSAGEVQSYLSLDITAVSPGTDSGQMTMSSEEYLSVRDQQADPDFFQGVKDLIAQIPESNGSKYYQRLNVNIGIVADEFLYRSLEGAANLFYITEDNYKDYLDRLDVFIVVSTWKGLGQEWVGLGNPKRLDMRKRLSRIMNVYKSKGIPVVFYSKEDPVNYDIFIDIAKQCDTIFTTAIEVVPQYKLDCQTDRVSVLQFGIEPCYHNPIGMHGVKQKGTVLFAGSCYRKYPRRTLDMEAIFDGVVSAGQTLKIIDRNFRQRDERYFFPAKYIPYLSPAIGHTDLQKLHKLYDWAVNLNSVKNSRSMMANRVYELQAIGNIVLSNDSPAIRETFPNVFIIKNQRQVKDIFRDFTDETIYKHQVDGVRRVMNTETSFHRMNTLLNFVGIPNDFVVRKVCVVVGQLTDKVQEMFDGQKYPEKTLIQLSEFTEAVKTECDMIAFFDEASQYGEHYLEDMINAFKYTDSDYITKSAYFKGDDLVDGAEHQYVEMIDNLFRTVLWSDAFSYDEIVHMRAPMVRKQGYSIDHFEYVEQG